MLPAVPLERWGQDVSWDTHLGTSTFLGRWRRVLMLGEYLLESKPGTILAYLP